MHIGGPTIVKISWRH